MSFTKLINAQVRPFFSENPETVGIEITGRCQLRCRHCFNYSGPENKHELDLSVIESLLDEMVEWGVRQIRVSGGEPTLHRQFREVVSACSDRGIAIGLNTHGIYTSSLLRYLKSAPIEIFFVSIDGLRERNDAIRGRGTFVRALNTCHELHLAGQQIMISFHVCNDNSEDIEGLIDLAAEIGVDIKISPIRPIGRARELMPQAVIAPEDYIQVVEQVTAARRRYPKIDILTDFDILDQGVGGACQRYQHDDEARSASCKAGRTMVNINYDGEIYPCVFFATPDKTFSAGNIKADSVGSAWASPTFLPFRTHTKSTDCQGCGHYKNSCVGGCPAVAHFSSGYLDFHDPTCFAKLAKKSGVIADV